MTKEYYLSNESIINREVKERFGRNIISSRDCLELSEDIFAKTHCQVSPNTLRRFFGLVKSEYATSLSTLRILSRYCGFHSLEEAYNIRNEPIQQENTVREEDVLNYLVSFFRDISLKDIYNESFQNIFKNTIDLLSRNPGFTDKFQNCIAKTKIGQEAYFEFFINIDKINSFYGNGLRYYLNEKKGSDAEIFAHSLLVFRYWLTMNNEMLCRHYQYLENIDIYASADPYFAARYFAAALYHANALKKSSDKAIFDALEFHSNLPANNNRHKSFPCFELTLCEALILTGHHEEGLYYISKAYQKNRNRNNYFDARSLRAFQLFELIALNGIGNKKKAKEIFEMVKPFDFHFLSKKYNTILYLFLSVVYKRKVLRTNEQLEELILETGFKRLEDIFGD